MIERRELKFIKIALSGLIFFAAFLVGVDTIQAATVPGAPTNLQAVPATGQASLSWTAPVSDGGSTITAYNLSYRLGAAGAFIDFSLNPATSTSATVTGLTSSSTYEFRVSAINSIGTSTQSTSTFATPGPISLFDSFSSTTIDTSKWVETDAGGLGGTVGNVRQNGSTLTVVGTGTYGNNLLSTVTSYDRTHGNIIVDADFSSSVCTGVGANSYLGFGYGDLPFTGSTSTAYAAVLTSTSIRLIYYNNGATTTGNSNFSCVANTPVHLSLLVKSAGGAALFINGSSTITASVIGGTFTNKSVFLQSGSAGATTTYDNVGIIAPDATPPVISSVSSLPGQASSTITWTTDEPADSQVVYGTTSSYGASSTLDATLTTSHSVNLSSLSTNTLYHYQVISKDVLGNTATSSDQTFTTGTSAPTPPTNLQAVPSSGEASLSWTAPSSDGGSPIITYELSYRLGAAGSFTDAVLAHATSTTAIVSGLTSSSTYEFQVRAVNIIGTSSPSSSTYVTPGDISLFDSFSTTTIDTTKWTETDAGGAGGEVGNVQQNGSTLTVVGTGSYGTNLLSSVTNFDRTSGSIILDADVTSSVCSGVGSNNYIGFGYGDTDLNAPTSNAYAAILTSSSIRLIYFNNGASTTHNSNFSCTANVPMHFSMVANPTGTVQLYINGSSTITASFINTSTFTNKPVFLQSASTGATITYDNVSVIASEDVTAPVISSVTISSITKDSATVSWTTNEPSDSSIFTGTSTGNYKLATSSPDLVTSHSLTLSDLVPATFYYIIVVSSDASENIATSAENTFTTEEGTISSNSPSVQSTVTVAPYTGGGSSYITPIRVAGCENGHLFNIINGQKCPATIPQSSISAVSSDYSFSRFLSLGSEGDDVKALQQALINLGFLPSGNDIGYFGPLTLAAVQEFQLFAGIVKSRGEAGYGRVGPKTKAVLNSL